MRNPSRSERAVVFLFVVLSAGATIVLGNIFPQSGQLRGIVTLKQANGTEVPAGQIGSGVQVSLNGTSAVSGATVFSDSTVTTAKGSSAVVSLGKLGRVEVLPESTMKLSFANSAISVSMLEAGRVRVSSSPGVGATATTNNAEVMAKGAQRNEFTVDTSCGNTFVAVRKGRVELRAGDSVKQIAAGSQDTAGQAKPGCTPLARR